MHQLMTLMTLQRNPSRNLLKTETLFDYTGDDMLVEAKVGNPEKIDILEEDEECVDSEATHKTTAIQH